MEKRNHSLPQIVLFAESLKRSIIFQRASRLPRLISLLRRFKLEYELTILRRTDEKMSLKDKITADLTAAMKAKDANRMGALRMVKAALMNEQNKKGADYVLSEEETMKTLNSLVKQRKDSIEQYNNANRADLAEKEQTELSILEEYLPQSATPEEIEIAVAEAIGETAASSMRDMGAVMKTAQAKLAGKTVDGKIVSETVKTKLSAL